MSWNEQVMNEFHKNHGKVGGNFKDTPLLLIHHVGARTGKHRVNPVVYLKEGNRYLIFASKGGADRNPDWYHNLKAHPDVQVEVGDTMIDVHVEEVKGEDRDRLYAKQAALFPYFGDYQRKTKRVIPVLALTPRNNASA